MSLKSCGFHATLYVVTDEGLREVAHKYTEKGGEEVKKELYKDLFEEFIESESFKELTYELGGRFTLEIEYLVHLSI